MTTRTQDLNPADRRLATILKADAAFCLACALPGLIAPGWLAGFLLPDTPEVAGFAIATVMLEVGIVLALGAAVLLLIALPATINRTLVLVSAGIDAALVAGTVLLLALAGGAFSTVGALVLAVIVVDTALIAWLKLRTLRLSAPAAVAA